MFLWIILAVFILLIATIIIFEIRNERKYQKSRREEKSKYQKPKREEKRPPRKPRIKIEPQTPTAPKVIQEAIPTEEPVKEPVKKTEPEIPKKILPECQYPTFKHDRLLEMGLSDSDAKEFVEELITQLDEQTNKIDDAINNANIHELELITHMIKGSASNLGTGGITDLLTEFNTYLKEGTDSDIIQTYANALTKYTSKLKAQYA